MKKQPVCAVRSYFQGPAGRHFTRDATTIDLADLSAEEIEDIEGDPVLSAQRIA